MDGKFAVNLNDYATVSVRRPGCGRKYQLRLRYDHSALAQKEKGEILIHCNECAKNKKLGKENFEVKALDDGK
jgi:hypothetical protein